MKKLRLTKNKIQGGQRSYIMLLTLIISLSAFVFGCKQKAASQDSVKLNDKNLNGNFRTAGDDKGEIVVTCSGSCTGGGECGMKWDLKGGTVECTCGGCSMTISNSNAMPALNYVLSYIKNDFEQHLISEYNDSVTVVNSFEMEYDSVNRADVLIINYQIPNSSQNTTVLYAIYYHNDYSVDRAVKIDCKATQCDCRERWVISAGTAECTCQQDCTMTVTELPDE